MTENYPELAVAFVGEKFQYLIAHFGMTSADVLAMHTTLLQTAKPGVVDLALEQQPAVIEWTAFLIMYEGVMIRLAQSHEGLVAHILPAIEMVLAWSLPVHDLPLLYMRTRALQYSYCVLNTSVGHLLAALALLFDQFSISDKELHVKTSYALSLLCEKCGDAISQPTFPMTSLVSQVSS